MYRSQLLNLALLALLLLFAATRTQAKTFQACNPVVTATLTSSYPPNTICETGPTSIVLTCSASAAVTGATYNFYQNGVLQISSSSNVFTVTLSQFSGITSASYTCQVITQAGQCASDQSAAVGIVKCSGPCLPQIAATLTSSYPLNTICTSPPGPSSIVLTCSANAPVTGALYNFYQDGVLVSSTSSNIYTVTIGQFASITAATFNCQIVTQSGQCTSDFSAAVLITKCSGGSCIPGVPSLISATGRLCEAESSTLRCFPAECTQQDLVCIAQYQYQLYRITLPNSVPVISPFQSSNTFTVTPVAGDRFYCKVQGTVPGCTGSQISDLSNLQESTNSPSVTLSIVSSICPSRALRAQINNPQLNTPYRFVLMRNGAILDTQVVPGVSFIPAGGIFVTFSTIPATGGNFVVVVNGQLNAQACPATSSNTLTLPPCSGGSCTPVPSVSISSSGTLCDNNALITVTVSGCAPGTIYDYTLQRAPLDSSVFSPLTTQTIPCSAGGTTSTTFSVTQTGIYRLSLTTASCSPVLSNTVVFDQTSSVATVTISASGTVCNSPVQSASVSCIISGFIPGTLTFEFFKSNNPSGFDFNTPFASQATNTLIISNVANGNLYYACRVRNEGGCAIVSTAPASVFVASCTSGGSCPIPATPLVVGPEAGICQGVASVISCQPAGCDLSNAACLAQYQYQLVRMPSNTYLPGPDTTGFQSSSQFILIPAAGESYQCRVRGTVTGCTGSQDSAYSIAVSSISCL